MVMTVTSRLLITARNLSSTPMTEDATVGEATAIVVDMSASSFLPQCANVKNAGWLTQTQVRLQVIRALRAGQRSFAVDSTTNAHRSENLAGKHETKYNANQSQNKSVSAMITIGVFLLPF